MYDLKIVVEEIKGFCDMPMKPGDYFEVKGGRIIIPHGKHMCLWALQSMMPLLPLKQRNIVEENDWVPDTKRICCPDPNGMVIYRIDRAVLPEKEFCINENPESNTLKPRMLVYSEKCTGCRACETACSFYHSGSFSANQSRVRIEKIESQGKDLPQICRQCGNALCIQACPTEALSKDDSTKAILIDFEKCIGCRQCLKVCNFDAIVFDSVANKPLICNLCGGSPNCVKRCASGALAYANAGDLTK